MARIWIDDQEVTVTNGTTVLEATRALGIDLPALCYRQGHKPNTSCMCCLVNVQGMSGPLPSCATEVEDGMRIACETDRLRELRRMGIELLLSDHAGDCQAPCQSTCPARMDIPDMLRQVAEGNYADAIATVKRDIALPATLGRVCPDVCERACRRGQVDQPAAICQVKRFVADRDLQSEHPYHPDRASASGRRVAIVGAGPTGLTAAYHLVCAGHNCTIFESDTYLGGRLRHEFSEQELPRTVLDAEIGVITELGAAVRSGCRVGQDVSVARLREQFDAVLLAVGAASAEQLGSLGVETSERGIRPAADGISTSLDGVFAAGNAVRRNKLVIQSVAAGKNAAHCINNWLLGEPASPPVRPFQIRLNRLDEAEIGELSRGASDVARVEPASDNGGLSEEQVQREAARCLHCECSAAGNCLLRHYADMYDCDPYRFRGSRRRVQRCLHGEKVSYEPGKCIDCGICIQIAEQAAEPLGLAYVGRGFDVRLSVPFDRPLDEALSETADACIRACPTGALALPDGRSPCALFCRTSDDLHQIEPVD